MSRPVGKVVVVGRDAAAWIAAAGLQSAFGRTGVSVQVVELPSLLSEVDVFPVLPTLAGLHRLLGIDERRLLEACAGTYVLGQRFANWSGGGAPFIHPYDTQAIGLNNVDLVQYWVKARAEGLAVELDEFSLGAAMAKQARLVLDEDISDTFSRPAHGYHLDAGSYVRFMKQRALRGGVTCLDAGLDEVRVADGRIAAVVLKDGQTLEADLFVDASGPDAALIGRLPGDSFESWAAWLGCDRVLAASGPALKPLPGFSQIAAFQAGWIGMYPLRDRTAIVALGDSGKMSDQDMLERVAVQTGLKLQGEAVVSPLAAGARRRPWIGNCVAIGEAAVALEPLDAAPLQVIQTGVTHLISFFPVDADNLMEAGAYNTALNAHADNIRDFQIAHYRLNQRRDEPFWDRAREMQVPPALAYKLALFAARGHIALYDQESFQGSNWTSIFIGHGLMPRDTDPQVDMLSRDEQIQQLQRMLRFIAGEVAQMPTLESQLAPPRAGALF
jgi:tryptophan halogenase